MTDIKLIAFDLDGTMLDDNKQLPEENRRALLAAADRGIELVPATGRLHMGLPECFRDLPIRYGIFINGAQVVDLQTGEIIYRAEVPWQQAVEVFTQADSLPILYDCYMDSRAYMSQSFFPRIPEYALNAHYLKSMQQLRTPVPELKEFIAREKRGVQKLQFYFRKDQYGLRQELLSSWNIPDIVVSTSVANNIELNQTLATKGHGLEQLTARLGISMAQVMAFGDGDNDRSMLQKAGFGIAMENAEPTLKKIARYTTGTNHEAGVARAIQKFIGGTV